MVQLRRLVLERLMLYHRYLTQERSPLESESVTSAEIAESLDIDPTQVRKDFGAIGLRGKGRVGFHVDDAVHAIRSVLGFDRAHTAVVVGTGHLGGALAAYSGFARYGVEVIAAFDSDPAKVGQEVGGCPVRHVRTMKQFLGRHQIQLAIIATPAEAAQDVANRLVDAGVTAIWNFAPVRLTLPPSVCLRNEHISLGLAELAYHLAKR